MSQPFSDIAVTNTGAAPCVLRGYPHIRVWGHRVAPDGAAPTVRQRIVVHHGIYERLDAGPHRVVVRPHHHVFFSIGTATAYQGGLHMLTLTRLTALIPGIHVAKTLSIDLFATRPAGRRIPVGITAITSSQRS